MLTTKEEFHAFIAAHPLFFIATQDARQPRVRAIMMHKVDENGIVFTTGKNKDFYKQLRANPNVELCFYGNNMQIRVTGTATEIDDDLAMKQEIVSSRPFMLSWIESVGYEFMGVFRISNAKATCWSMDAPLTRKRFITLFE